MTPPADPRVCPADGGDHDWQDTNRIFLCARPMSQSVRISTGTCSKCRTARQVTDGPKGREIVDEPGLAGA